MSIKTTINKKTVGSKTKKVVSKSIKTTAKVKINRTAKIKKKISTKKEPSVYKRKTVLQASNSIAVMHHHTPIINTEIKSKIKGKYKSRIIFKVCKFLFQLSILVALIVALMYGYNKCMNYFYTNEKFFIDDIVIEGCDNVTESEVRNLINFNVNDSLLKISLFKSEKDLMEKKPELKNVCMTRKWKQKKVIVSIKERVPEVFLIENDKKIGLDFDNKPFKLRGYMSQMKIPTLVCSTQEQQESLLKFFKKVKKNLLGIVCNITEIKYGEIDDIVLVLNNQTNVFWGFAKQNKIEEKSKALLAILNDLSNKNQQSSSIDLSYLDNNKQKAIVKMVKPI